MIFRTCLSALFLLGSALLAVAGGPHPSLPRPFIPDCLGVNIDFTKPQPGEMEMLAIAGFKWVRVNLTWATTERKTSDYDFSTYDALVAELDKHRLRAVFVLGYGNPLYAEPGDKEPFTSRAHTPEFQQAFARWSVAAMKRFAGRGHLWELWHEPNERASWKSSGGRADYIALVKVTGEALRAANLLGENREAFIGPSTATIDQPFLQACFKAGLLDYWDAVSVHPSRETAPENIEPEYRAVRVLIRQYAPKDKSIPLISGPSGYSSTAAGFDEQKQAQYLPRQILTDIANDVTLSIWSAWRDGGGPLVDPQQNFGLVRHDYRVGRDPVFEPKPAYQAMKVLTEELAGLEYNKTLEYPPGTQGLLFARGDEARVAVWNKADAPHAIKLPFGSSELTFVQRDGQKTAFKKNKEANPALGLSYTPGSNVAYVGSKQQDDLLRTALSIKRLPLEMVFDTPGSSPPFNFSFENPTAKSFFFRLLTDMEQPELEGNFALTLLNERAAAGQKFARSLTVRSMARALGAEKHHASLYVFDDPATQAERGIELRQMTRVVPANPLFVTRLPGLPGEILLKIENPSGKPWSGTAMAVTATHGKYGMGKSGFRPTTEAVPVVLPQKVRDVVVRIPLPKEKDDSWPTVREIVLIAPDQSGDRFSIPDVRLIPLDAANVEILPDGDSKTVAVPKATAEPPPEGAPVASLPTLRLRYSFSEDRKFFRVINPTWPPPGEKDPLRTPLSLSLWIYGDGQGCIPRIRFTDATEQVFQSSGPRIDWKGWREVTFSMISSRQIPLESWGGQGDAKIHYPIELDSIFLFENAERKKLDGEIYVSAPTLIYQR